MRWSDLINLSTRMFKARTSRTLLTILGMGVGIGAILFLVSLGYGLQKTLLERITTSESLLTLDATEPKSGAVKLSREMLGQIKTIQGVKEISPAFHLAAQGNLEGVTADLTAVGIEPSYVRLSGMNVKSGEAINEEKTNEVVVSSSIVSLFGRTQEDVLGKEITFSFFVPDQSEDTEALERKATETKSDTKYLIVGITESDDTTVYINASTLASLNIDRFSQVKVRAISSGEMGPIRDQLLGFGLLVSSLSDVVDQANQIFKIIQFILMLFGIVALVVSAIGMFNTMTIALLERTEEIGIMKSIGASDFTISMIFVMESTIMGFLGGLGGVALGLLGGSLFNVLTNLVAQRFGGKAVSLFYSPTWFILAIVAFAAVVGFITGFIPARRASKIDPLDALRYK
jgi:putative ABC transport system permease protein